MNAEIAQKENLLYRLLLALLIIAIAAALRIAPHPWNFTPIGAMVSSQEHLSVTAVSPSHFRSSRFLWATCSSVSTS